MAKILVIDDNAMNRKLVVAVLGFEGHQIIEAEDGAEGLACARAECPDLIISDILMPSMDGYQFVRELRADAQVGNVAVIFYTAYYHEEASSSLADSLGVARVIVKPCPTAEFVRGVADVLAGAQRLRPIVGHGVP